MALLALKGKDLSPFSLVDDMNHIFLTLAFHIYQVCLIQHKK